MKVDVVLLPREVDRRALGERAVVVFDVLRATTTMTAALGAGAREIRIFGTLDAAADAARGYDGPRVLCGEAKCLPPAGFDLGNSPGSFTAGVVEGKTLFMCTTNGTRALVAAREAPRIYAAALVNARAAARAAAGDGRDVLLLCAGTDGAIAMEDVIGAGAVADHLVREHDAALASDAADMAVHLFRACRSDLPGVLGRTRGGRNVIEAGLREDIEFAARLDTMDIVGRCDGATLTVTVIV